ncbi:hypothetical protein [Methylomonas rosea]|uniref:Uncharacterized protein n=1 Tax=Methylomonas rosea TaxID=2952227 RepID=A0ABT1TSF9_9GAMM|nr:hypothetical protein [Methylomonas sp. WSC-7]MCQ8117003.1 hypothetical protein [Methylomonas sp. WSC-7]
MSLHNFTLFADYFQFYIQDESVGGSLADAWNKDAFARMLAVAPGVVAVGTVRNTNVPVSIEILDSVPSLDLDDWDHLVECSILIKNNSIAIAGCTDYLPEAARIDISPGTYRVRVGYAGLATVSADILTGDDHYALQLWQAEAIEPTVLKQFKS